MSNQELFILVRANIAKLVELAIEVGHGYERKRLLELQEQRVEALLAYVQASLGEAVEELLVEKEKNGRKTS